MRTLVIVYPNKVRAYSDFQLYIATVLGNNLSSALKYQTFQYLELYLDSCTVKSRKFLHEEESNNNFENFRPGFYPHCIHFVPVGTAELESKSDWLQSYW